ncbi:dihydrolipoamide acetyltransferase family protein [Gudongella sp. DL1XJH-153]|uniref:dihydrolipoamide acetyltransferase family protein n=1 Tax=Gudongella sp. DL1XJH-153 TaxID=3409804 RepID=UPI003BB7D8A3
MAKKIVMPKLGLTMKEGKLAKWYKAEGDPIKIGDKLFSIETDKITNDSEATEEGVLRKIIVHEGNTVPIMEPVGIVAGADEDISSLLADVPEASSEKSETKDDKIQKETEPEKRIQRTGKIKVSPVARKLAEEEGIDVETIEGTGPGGRIVLDDVKNAVENKDKIKASPTAEKVAKDLGVDASKIASEKRVMKDDVLRADKEAQYASLAQPEDRRIPLTTMRKIIGERMSESTHTAPTVNFTISVDMTNLKSLREELKVEKSITYTDLIVKVTSLLLLEHPYLNSSLDGEEIVLRNYVNMGVAVALEDGLLVPVVKNAHVKKLGEISDEIKDLSYRAKTNQLTTDEIEGGTFTVTNIGMFGIESFTPIINQPESAILGVNAIVETPVVVGGCVCTRPLMKLSLTADHRTVDGAVAAMFLARLKEVLEHPLRMLL